MHLGFHSFHGLHNAHGFLFNSTDHIGDVGGARRGALCKHPDLIGYHGEATALFTRACRFDGGIQCQQVGLVGDALDHLRDFGNFLDCAAEFPNRRA